MPFRYTLLCVIASSLLNGMLFWLSPRAEFLKAWELFLAFSIVYLLLFTAVYGAGYWFYCKPKRVRFKGPFYQNKTRWQPYFWKFAMDNVPDYFYAKDLQGRYLGQNKALLDFYGHKLETDVLGKSNYDLYTGILSKEHLDILEENDLKASYSDVPILVEEAIPQANGEIKICESMKCSYRSTSGEVLGMISVSRDITLRKQMELEVLRSRAVAQDASKAKSEFLANMSHEIRTPMNGIIGLAHLALQVPGINSKLHDYIAKIDSSAKVLLRIINDILDFSKIDAGKLELEHLPFDLIEVLEGIIQPIMPSITDKGLEIIIDFAEDTPAQLIGDAVRLRQVMLNLVANAIKFTHSGSIVLSVSKVSQTETQAILQFVVADTGIGMSPEYFHRLFESFAQADTSITRRYGGTGLGLAICKNLVQLMGGEISVTSSLGEGSAFTFTAAFGLANTALPVRESGHDLNNKKILVVDDSELSRKVFRSYLERFGAIVDEAEESTLAIIKFETAQGQGTPYHAVIVDWKISSLNGVEIAAEIRKTCTQQQLPIIMVTAYNRDHVFADACAVGINEVLTKPVTPSTLHDALVRVTMSEQEALEFSFAQAIELSLAASEKPSLLKGKKVLLAEDNEINQLIGVEILSGFGMLVTVASNGVEAVSYALSEPFDVILMDIQMPEMDGIDATLRIRGDRSLDSIPIIAMTAHAMTGDHEKSIEAGMQEHITKPIDPEALYRTLIEWVVDIKVAKPIL